jgi:hypothetical protein
MFVFALPNLEGRHIQESAIAPSDLIIRVELSLSGHQPHRLTGTELASLGTAQFGFDTAPHS